MAKKYRRSQGWVSGDKSGQSTNIVAPAGIRVPAQPENPVVPPNTPVGPYPIIPAPKQDALERSYAEAMLPYLSVADRSTLGDLYGFPSGPGKPGFTHQMLPAPGEAAPAPGGNRNVYLSKQRAEQAMASLEAARAAGKGAPDDAGYAFLNQSIELLKQFGGAGGGEGMTRAAYQELTTRWQALLDQAKQQKVPVFYQQMAQMFMQPTFADGKLMETDKYGFGKASKRLFA